MNRYHNTFGFTLVELIVSISIMSIILVAIMSVFFSMNNVSQKTDIQRQLQINTKNAIESMAEDMRSHGVNSTSCSVIWADNNSYWCSNAGNKYYLWKKDDLGVFSVASIQYCTEIKNNCYILKNGIPLTNSFLSVTWLHFMLLGNEDIPRLSIQMHARPAVKKWISSWLAEASKVQIQTTISQSFLKQ